jgi:hypothetical protein
MAKGFRIIDEQVGWSVGLANEINSISFNDDGLLVHFELLDGTCQVLRCKEPVSFRAQHEGEIYHYWLARHQEGVGVGTVYLVTESSYLDEISKGGIAGLTDGGLNHYSANMCVEVIAQVAPQLGTSSHS